jgi:hypothetical protein
MNRLGIGTFQPKDDALTKTIKRIEITSFMLAPLKILARTPL